MNPNSLGGWCTYYYVNHRVVLRWLLSACQTLRIVKFDILLLQTSCYSRVGKDKVNPSYSLNKPVKK